VAGLALTARGWRHALAEEPPGRRMNERSPADLMIRTVAVFLTAADPVEPAVRAYEFAFRLALAVVIHDAGATEPAVRVTEWRGRGEVGAAWKSRGSAVEETSLAAEGESAGSQIQAAQTSIAAVLVTLAAA